MFINSRMNKLSILTTIILIGLCLAVPQLQHIPTNSNTNVFSQFAPQSIPSNINGVPKTMPFPVNNIPGNSISGEMNSMDNNQTQDCKCVPYYQCNNDDTIITDGVGIIDIRMKDECNSYLDTCCKLSHILRNTSSLVSSKPLIRRGCGQRHHQGVGFKITGNTNNETEFGEFPWMTAVLGESIVNGQIVTNAYKCGGSLIHFQAVLTAAHCVYQLAVDKLKIRAGEWDTQTNIEPLPHQNRDVSKVVIHPGFNPLNLFNDFAILILKEPVKYADNVDFVCLPGKNEIFDYSQCIATGWGRDLFGTEGQWQVILKRVELTVVNYERCLTALRSTRLGYYFQLHSSFICAGGESGIDTCRGDGGSPLSCPLKNDPTRYVQAGIVAWGIGCGETRVPGVYASVSYARDWIDQKLYENGLQY